MQALRQTLKTLLLAIVVSLPFLFVYVVLPFPFGLMGGPPIRITDAKLLPKTLEISFAADQTLQTDFDVWQISGLPDRQCVW